MSDTPKHSVSVAGIVVDDENRVLVIQRRDNGHWEPPGGVLELHESPEDGVVREVLEETGIAIEVERLSGVYKNMEKGVLALVFRCRMTGGRPKTTDESVTVSWGQLDKVASDMSEAYAVRVADAFESGVQVRIHDGVRLMNVGVGQSSKS